MNKASSRTIRSASLSPIYAALLLTLAAAGSAQAQVTHMQATGSYDLDAGTLVGSNVQTYPSSNPVDVLNFPSTGASNGGYHSYGSTSGNFGSRSSGAGVYDIASAYGIKQTVTNTSATGQNAIFNFHITPGLLMNSINSTMVGSDFVKSGIGFNIQSNGSSVWHSQADLSTTAGGTVFNLDPTGANLYTNTPGNPTFYSIAGGSFSVNLGFLNPGQSLTLEYDINTYAQGHAPSRTDIFVPGYSYDVPGQWVTCKRDRPNGDCPGGTGVPVWVPGHTVTVPDHTITAAASGSHASSGDPFDINFDGSPAFYGVSDLKHSEAFVSFAPAVPEPSSYALVLAGLSALAWVVRVRRPQAQADRV